MPVRPLPANPDLRHLQHEARALQQGVRAGRAEALATLREFHPRFAAAAAAAIPDFQLTAAQFATARRYGFASWKRLRQHLETVRRYARTPHRIGKNAPADRAATFLRLCCLHYGSDDRTRWEEARAMLQAEPALSAASIHLAAAVGDVAAARAMLAAEPGLARLPGGPHDWEPLLYLAYSRLDSGAPGHDPLAVARLLLAHGADPNAGYLWEGLPSPFTALTGAFGGGEHDQPPHRFAVPLARLLLEAGADPNDAQALYNRQFRRDDDHLVLLFEFGLGRGDGGPWHARLAPAHPSPDQMLADQLLWAVRQDLRERVRLLLRHGVQPDARSGHPIHRARTALELARLCGHDEIAALLRAAGAAAGGVDPVVEFAGACMRADGAAVARLLAADPTLAARTIEREPELLLHAAELGRTDAVRTLVAAGYPVNARIRVTPLHGAAWNGHVETIAALVALGADADLRDTEYGGRPVDWAGHAHRDQVVAWFEAHRGGGA